MAGRHVLTYTSSLDLLRFKFNSKAIASTALKFEALSMMLTMMGNEVRTANDGMQAVKLAEEFRPNVIMLDIGMPVLNGYEACRRLREYAWTKEVVFLAMTGWGQDEDKRRSQVAGFDHHIVKPVDFVVLEKLLASL